MEANPNYWGWEGEEPPYDQIIFRLFENPDAMVAALQEGGARCDLRIPPRLRRGAGGGCEHRGRCRGQQGGFDEIAHQRWGQAEGQPHPGPARHRGADGPSPMPSTMGR